MEKKKATLEIVALDPWLEPYEKHLEKRLQEFFAFKRRLLGTGDSFGDFANGHHYFGFHLVGQDWVYREWAPMADELHLIGEFNGWNRSSHPLVRKDHGVFELILPGKDSLRHGEKVKVFVKSQGKSRDRIPLYIHRVVQDPVTGDFAGQIWAPEEAYSFKEKNFKIPQDQAPLIYEAHIGMAQEEGKIGTYQEFEEVVLPKVKALGYNTLQLMAIMEHPYYASFGYQVSNFFAASSRFGTPEELKSLVDKAHSLGISVLMDLVHSHGVKNLGEGINEFDGTVEQFFHSGVRGQHPAWDSKVFNYGKPEVVHFLLSSIKYFMEEYRFDGFRFDGVTSMLYMDHGLGRDFNGYDTYFSDNTDQEGLAYLQCACSLIKELRPDALTVAEDMSGMPGMCLPIKEGGLGFDYRLGMGMPDFWIKTLERRDEDWDLVAMFYALSTGRLMEKCIAYVESHDQALVGDKTFLFRLVGEDMYWHMSKGNSSPKVERGLALHKMARLATISLGGEGYLTFMGNEFGHPEWIDFPREGNGGSFHYCRRQWSLAEDKSLRYGGLQTFEKEMVSFMLSRDLFHEGKPTLLWLDSEGKVLVYRRKKQIFVFNFHPSQSHEGYKIPIHEEGNFQVVFDSDERRFEGFGRISHEQILVSLPLEMEEEYCGLMLNLPARTAMVLEPQNNSPR